MSISVVLSGIVGFIFLIALNLASGAIQASSVVSDVSLKGSATPVADIVTNALGSVLGDIFLVLVTFSIFACGLVIFITATRLIWAMSRDQRFPWMLVTRPEVLRTPPQVEVTAREPGTTEAS